MRSGYRGPRVATGNFATGYTTNNVFGRVDQQAREPDIWSCATAMYNVTSANARNVGGLSDVSRGAALDDTDQTVAAS